MKKLTVLLSSLALLTLTALGQNLNNVRQDGVSIQGYDPVAFFKVGRPVKGDPKFESSHGGAKYHFSSADHKAEFDKDPEKYRPQFGGYCAYGVSRDALAPIKIEAWQIVNGRLLMQKNESVRDLFNKDPQVNLSRADKNWPGLVKEKGK